MRGDKRERILRVLLSEEKPLSRLELSKRAECTRQWVILFLRQLEKKNLIKGTNVLSGEKLLNYWLGLKKDKPKFKMYMVRDPLPVLKKSNLDYALTTYQAENLVQHYLFPSRTDLYVKQEDMEKWHGLMVKNGLYGSGNVRLIPYDKHVFYKRRKINGLFAVSLPQLIIDLLKEGGPCGEAAEMLLKRL
ncbi:MAG: hypothetical protein PHO02_07170 [Candidatus Nanoarchaeia archaeon]|nr:hypothetical protein [Candidatus Nanoarchaeia archaeon]